MEQILLLTLAVQNLVPTGSKWTVRGTNIPDDIWCENEADVPTEEAIKTEMDRLQVEYDAQEYARNRQAEFPSIVDVTVALAEKAEGNSTMWDTITAERLAVKAKYPKP